MKRRNGIDVVKISVSVAAEDLAILRRRAKRLYRGNLSAVIHELVQKAKKQEAMEKLIASLGYFVTAESAYWSKVEASCSVRLAVAS